VQELRFAAEAAGANTRLLRQRFDAGCLVRDENICRALPFRDGSYHETIDWLGWQILATMNGQIDLVIDQGTLQLLGEQTLAADLSEGPGFHIALRRDED
jgi:hypothetical protein